MTALAVPSLRTNPETGEYAQRKRLASISASGTNQNLDLEKRKTEDELDGGTCFRTSRHADR